MRMEKKTGSLMSATLYLYRDLEEELLTTGTVSRAIGRCFSRTFSAIMQDVAHPRYDRANDVERTGRIILILSWNFSDGSCNQT